MNNDSERFERMASAHRSAIARLCRHHEASPDARRDLEQEIMVELWRALRSFRGECSERTFVLRVAHNTAVRHVARSIRTRSAAAASVRADDWCPSAADDRLDSRATLARVEERLRAMDLASQQLVLLALEGCTTGEIADVTGLTPTNVTTRLSRLRKALTAPLEALPLGAPKENHHDA